MLVNTKTVNEMGKAPALLLTGINMVASGRVVYFMVKVHIHLLAEANT